MAKGRYGRDRAALRPSDARIAMNPVPANDVIYEVVLTTRSATGALHIAPMGVRYRREAGVDQVVVMPFKPSTTLDKTVAPTSMTQPSPARSKPVFLKTRMWTDRPSLWKPCGARCCCRVLPGMHWSAARPKALHAASRA